MAGGRGRLHFLQGCTPRQTDKFQDTCANIVGRRCVYACMYACMYKCMSQNQIRGGHQLGKEQGTQGELGGELKQEEPRRLCMEFSKEWNFENPHHSCQKPRDIISPRFLHAATSQLLRQNIKIQSCIGFPSEKSSCLLKLKSPIFLAVPFKIRSIHLELDMAIRASSAECLGQMV